MKYSTTKKQISDIYFGKIKRLKGKTKK
jgi:hypothetical protein